MPKRGRPQWWPDAILVVVALAIMLRLFQIDDSPMHWVSYPIAAIAITCSAILARLRLKKSWPYNSFMAVALGGFLVLILFRDSVGFAGGVWLTGLFAGMGAGSWSRVVHERRHPNPTYPWNVGDRGFRSKHDASDAAYDALNGLDGSNKKTQHAFLTVSHESARFEVAGDVHEGLVCHYNPDADDDSTWHVLVNPGVEESSGRVDVPMGRWMPSIPGYLVNDLPHATDALRAFIQGDPLSTEALEWRAGGEAEATRLSSP